MGTSVPRSSVTGVQDVGGADLSGMLKRATEQLALLQQAVGSIRMEMREFHIELSGDAVAAKYAECLGHSTARAMTRENVSSLAKGLKDLITPVEEEEPIDGGKVLLPALPRLLKILYIMPTLWYTCMRALGLFMPSVMGGIRRLMPPIRYYYVYY